MKFAFARGLVARVAAVVTAALGTIVPAVAVAGDARETACAEWRVAQGSVAQRPVANASGTEAPDSALRIRWAVRMFASDFSDRVELAADRIAAASDDPAVRDAALRWKLGASTAAMRAGLRPPGQLALADTWVLARQSLALIDGGPAGQAFGAQQSVAVDTARALADEAERLACGLLDAAAFDAYGALVASHIEREPLAGLGFERAPIAMAWLRVAFDVGGMPWALVSVSELGADAFDRADELARRVPAWARWSSELTVAEHSERLGAVGRGLRAIASEPVDSSQGLFSGLRDQASRALVTVDQRWGQTLDALGGERRSFVRTLFDSSIVRDVLKGLGIVVLSLVGIGAAIGWAAARAWERRRARRAPALR